jgi:hypothetical protein
MAKLKVKGLSALYNNIIDNIWAAAAHVEGHITTQMEKNMATLSESITRLGSAVANEFEQIKAQAEANLEATKEALEQVGGENEQLKDALEEQVSANEDLLTQISEAQARLDSFSTELESNDEAVYDPDAPRPDNTLPTGGDANTGGDHVDNTLPGEQPYPDQSLPGDQPEANQDLPQAQRGNRRGQRK